MATMKLKVKRLHEGATLPIRATAGAGGLDLYAAETVAVPGNATTRVPTGIAVELPKGMTAFIKTRSSTTLRNILVFDCVLDADYTGEVYIAARSLNPYGTVVKKGERIAQMVVLRIPDIEPIEVEELAETARGAGGFGSTGQ